MACEIFEIQAAKKSRGESDFDDFWTKFPGARGYRFVIDRYKMEVAICPSGRPAHIRPLPLLRCSFCSPRYLLRTIEAVSIPHRQSGASSRARDAHGVQPNSHHVPSSRGARDLAESAFQLIFREGSRSGFPGEGKAL